MVGSSRKSTFGVWTSAQASPSFCFIPPERFPARRRLNGVEVAENASSASIFSCPPLPRDAVEVGIEVDVLHDGEVGVQTEPLAHVPDLPVDLPRLRADE